VTKLVFNVHVNSFLEAGVIEELCKRENFKYNVRFASSLPIGEETKQEIIKEKKTRRNRRIKPKDITRIIHFAKGDPFCPLDEYSEKLCIPEIRSAKQLQNLLTRHKISRQRLQKDMMKKVKEDAKLNGQNTKKSNNKPIASTSPP